MNSSQQNEIAKLKHAKLDQHLGKFFKMFNSKILYP